MKNLYKLMAWTVGLFSLSACDADRDSNPILGEPDTFVLNVPAFAENNVYDLLNSESLLLTCSQPAYGMPMATTYSVQVSLDEEFVETDEEAGTVANYLTLGTTYTSTRMEVSALELALALGDLWSASSDEKFPADPIPVSIRLKAELTNSGRGVAYSNTIELPRVLGYEAVPPLEIPATLYVNGSMAGSNWSNWIPLAALNGVSKFFGVFYFSGSDMFKFGTKEGEYIGFNDSRVSSASDLFSGQDDGFGGQNIAVAASGWYTVIISVGIKGTDYAFTLDLAPCEIYLIGNSIGSWNFSEEGRFVEPETADADFISPACTGSGELRMSVKIAGEDWWRSEFTIVDGKIFFRENRNIFDSWSEIGAEYMVGMSAGQQVHLNFVQRTGSVQ